MGNSFAKEQKQGSCPEILNKGWHQYHGENKVLNHTKLEGDWTRIYDSIYEKDDCTGLKLKRISPEELVDRGIDADKFRTKAVMQVDHLGEGPRVLVFDGSVAQIDSIKNLEKGTLIGSGNKAQAALDTQSLEYLEDIELNVPPEMSPKELELSTPEYIESYNAHRLEMQEARDVLYKELSAIQARFDDASTAGSVLQVLDTDYESYLMLFMCKEHEKYADEEGRGFIEVQTSMFLKEIELAQKKNRISLAQECLKEFAPLSSYADLQALFKREEPSLYDEIDAFISIGHGHKDHFQYGNEPSLLEWTEIREFYRDDFEHQTALDDIQKELKYIQE